MTDIKVIIRKARREAPSMEGCIRCGKCCGPLKVTHLEVFKVVSTITRKGLWPEVRDNLNRALNSTDPNERVICPMLRMIEGKSACMVYNQRPIVCRLQGTKKTLPCPNAKEQVIPLGKWCQNYYDHINTEEDCVILSVEVGKALDRWQVLGDKTATDLLKYYN